MSNLYPTSLLSPSEPALELAAEAKTLNQKRSALNNRRNFLTGLAGAAAAAGALGMAGCSNDGTVSVTATSTTPSVLDVLTFALNLEYLEANFYLYLYQGSGLSSTDNGGTPSITGGAKYTSTSANATIVNTLLMNLAQEEQAHVQFLRATITSVFNVTPVACPNLNLAALGTVTSDATLLSLARQLEATGVSAYAGGATYLASSTAALTYAAQILHVEAQHEALIRQLCIQTGVTSSAIDSLDVAPTASTVFNVNSMGLSPSRTTSQVLQIVYGASGKTGVSSGGFYPNGLNGNIKTS